MGSRKRNDVNYRNPCLTMHQPWASLLVYGIKRIEGRSWPSPITGRLWIHAAGKVPEATTIKAMEEFYRELYALDGITDLQFPQHYPTSRLLGCIEVVGCVTRDELLSWEAVPQGVRLEGQTDYCWLCEQPQKLIVPFEMRGYQGVYNLERKIYEAAVRGLSPVTAPISIKFPVYVKSGGTLASFSKGSNASKVVEESSNLSAAIAGARAAATQFSKNNDSHSTTGKVAVEYKPVSTKPSNINKEDGAQIFKAAIAGVRAAATQFSKHNSFQPTTGKVALEYRPVSARTRNMNKENGAQRFNDDLPSSSNT